MKKINKVLLVGALALGGTTVTSQIISPIQAQAASDVFHDEWGFWNYSTLSGRARTMNAYENAQIQDGYHNGQWFKLQLEGTEHRPGTNEDKVKIFRKHPDGSLQRYKTMDPQFSYKADGTPVQTWTTQFNNVYPPGEYVAISYINGYYFYSKTFIVNQ